MYLAVINKLIWQVIDAMQEENGGLEDSVRGRDMARAAEDSRKKKNWADGDCRETAGL